MSKDKKKRASAEEEQPKTRLQPGRRAISRETLLNLSEIAEEGAQAEDDELRRLGQNGVL